MASGTELRKIIEASNMAEIEVAEMNCKNCGRSGKITQILLHHIVPRESCGGNEQDNRLPLCSACERFIHFRYSNNVLMELKEKVLQEKDVQLFGIFVNSPEYIKRPDVRDIENDFEKWKTNYREEGCQSRLLEGEGGEKGE